ncbi:MAG: hypothetical protein C4584_02540 [Armatimonadetes bacterium]|nr:MAG: hypothetical protein C4584_02540 [Armatimonadota bacterium]
MVIDNSQLLKILVEGFSFIAAFAGVTAGVVMLSVTKKFGTGILASGFKSISAGVLFIAFGIIVDAVQLILQFSGISANIFMTLIIVVKGVCFVVGTYIIVIGSKNTADKLESLTQ